MTEGQAIFQLWQRPLPAGKVRHWTDDGQGGGWIEFLTPEESARRDAKAEAEAAEEQARWDAARAEEAAEDAARKAEEQAWWASLTPEGRAAYEERLCL
ncbi:hypothetical protein N9917_01480 [Deltaproteobacteria bacterium]|nr:hypothetical protein [Deltaproteobacteria bacterium]